MLLVPKYVKFQSLVYLGFTLLIERVNFTPILWIIVTPHSSSVVKLTSLLLNFLCLPWSNHLAPPYHLERIIWTMWIMHYTPLSNNAPLISNSIILLNNKRTDCANCSPSPSHLVWKSSSDQSSFDLRSLWMLFCWSLGKIDGLHVIGGKERHQQWCRVALALVYWLNLFKPQYPDG
jgi:hypothetical protein